MVDESRAPLTEHLAELRNRLIKALGAWILASIVAWTYKEQIFAQLLAPAVAAGGVAATGGAITGGAGAAGGSCVASCSVCRRSVEARLNSFIARPSDLASSGSRLGPKTINATARITRSSVMPMPNIPTG